MEVIELGCHPRHIWAGGGGLPDGGQAHALAPQAGEAHGCKRRGTVLLTSTKDTVIFPVKKYTLHCGHQSQGSDKSCPFMTGDHIASNLVDDHRWLMVIHLEVEHDAPQLVMVEGSVDKVSGGAFSSWYSWSYWGPRKMNLWMEIMHVFVQQPEQPPKHEQLHKDRFTADGVTVMEQQGRSAPRI